ncbi:MAG TPA: cache domain-containing protein [Desulfotignum sp.]|nr:cache domain-containing protein [Desulfotignum sp.]
MEGIVNKENGVIDTLFYQKPLSDVLRILIPLYITYIIFALGMFLVFIPQHESQLLDQKKETIRQLTNSAVSLLADYESRISQGEMTREGARQKAVDRIRNLRYGLQGKDYFWINDMHPFMIMHPFRPELEGEDLTRIKDSAGNYPFVEMVKTVKENGEGYVNYSWQWKDMPEKIAPKMSYVKGFAPWNWIIGTGIYMDDITKEITAITRHLILIFLGLLFLVILMSFYISRQVVRIDQKKNMAEKARQLNEDDLRRSEERYRLLAENATDVIWIMQTDTLEISYVSPAIENLLGYGAEEFMQLDVTTYMGEASVKRIKAVIAAELAQENDPDAAPDRMRTLELEMCKKDGTAVWVEIVARFLRNESGCPDRILGTSRDITQRKRLEDRIKQTQKMEALGTLAGGIAHDFNNILSSIIGFTELAKLDLSDNAEALASLEQVMTAGLRARDLVQHILTFSRKADVQHQVIKIVPLVKECLKFIKASAPPDIEIRKKMMEKEVAVLADPSQIHQMIMNLLTNAVHAMKEGGGTLDVTIKSIVIHTDEILQTRDISAGRYVQILISDTGCGIPGPLKEKIFEPFFTTKRRGEGTGMGLSTVYGIVKDLKGDISVYSEPGTGTTFQVLIPEKKTGADQETFLSRAALVTGKGSILVVDDEPSIVAWTSKVLAKLGYAVAVASGGQKALDMLANDPARFDLVITDLSMPKMDGLALSHRINRICPDIPIILCTGFSEGLKPALIESCNIFAMIMKPMIASELSAIVNKALKKDRQKEHIQ